MQRSAGGQEMVMVLQEDAMVEVEVTVKDEVRMEVQEGYNSSWRCC